MPSSFPLLNPMSTWSFIVSFRIAEKQTEIARALQVTHIVSAGSHDNVNWPAVYRKRSNTSVLTWSLRPLRAFFSVLTDKTSHKRFLAASGAMTPLNRVVVTTGVK